MGLPACSLVSSTLAIPIVVFGAVSLIQQAKQAKEDKDLRLKAINTHNTFLSQEDEESAQPEQSSSSISSGVAASSPDDNFSSADNPHTATPAMLDHPERPEPTLAGAHVNDSSHARAAEQEASQLPPQTAVLDRPERPEPETAPIDANLSIHQDGTAPILQPQASATSMVAPQAPTSPHSPNSLQQVVTFRHECLFLSHSVHASCAEVGTEL